MKKKYAQVIINQSNVNIDQYFDYKIPLALAEKIKEGHRVIVPFGWGNKKIDAFVIKIKDNCEIEESKIKDIEQIIDYTPILTANQLKLAQWIKEHYLCLHVEALQIMIPAGISIEKKQVVILNIEKIESEKSKYTGNSFEARVIRYLYEQQREIDLEEINNVFPDQDINRKISAIVKKGYISIVESFDMKVKEKQERYISLSGKHRYKEEYLKDIKNGAHKQKEIINYLDHFPCKLSELRNKVNFANSSIEGLVQKELIKITSKMILRNPYGDKIFKNPKVPLTKEQNMVVDEFSKITNNSSQKMLIHGVTGSGKTEIYLNMIEIMLKKNKQSILLVPEISLTPQMVERVIGRFGEKVSVLHSRLSHGEKFDQWKMIKSGNIKIVIGARSAIFAPLDQLGLIIIDEEHETSYKSSNRPRYHAKEVAEKRCQIEGCHLVLGSATPSIESYYKGENKEYHLLSIKHRVDNIPMPEIKLIDMRDELREGNYSILSKELREAIHLNLEKKQQSILFLNRRGHSTFISCRQCGHVEKCPHCDVSLTYHHNNKRLMCHYCGYGKPAPILCPSCKSKKIKYFGTGTQKVENIIEKEFPNAKILRMDVDTTKRKGAHDRIINSFRNEEADILIGTQMIAKGLDFPKVTLVGVIIADTSLNLPDFRAAERTFQLTTQVAGRAGRGALLGKVIVQTYEPDHYSLLHAKGHDYINFYQEEIALRKEMLYPPFKNIINIVFTCEKEEKLIKMINEFHIILMEHLKKQKQDHLLRDVFKPVPSPISKVKNKYRWHMIIKTEHMSVFRKILGKLYFGYMAEKHDVNMAIDINPTSML